jgi:hypothetical protein
MARPLIDDDAVAHILHECRQMGVGWDNVDDLEAYIAAIKAVAGQPRDCPMARMAKDLACHGGSIVSSNVCSVGEIAAAQACGRFYVDEDGLGFVRRPPADLNDLTPAPWASVRQAYQDGTLTGKCVLAHGMTTIAVFEREADCDFAARARNQGAI